MIPDNAPQWLKDAKTENANVEILDIWPYVIWHGGEWHGGSQNMRTKWHSLIVNGKISIGCKTQSVDDWIKFFESEEIYLTPRNTVEFKMIEANFYGLVEYGKRMGLLNYGN